MGVQLNNFTAFYVLAKFLSNLGGGGDEEEELANIDLSKASSDGQNTFCYTLNILLFIASPQFGQKGC